jgi:hypothetical protein
MVALTVANSMVSSVSAQPATAGITADMLQTEQPQAAGNVTQGGVPEVYVIVCPPGWTDPAQCDVIRIL